MAFRSRTCDTKSRYSDVGPIDGSNISISRNALDNPNDYDIVKQPAPFPLYVAPVACYQCETTSVAATPAVYW